ncbi:FAD-dependent oxidoreductase [Streptomyces sp. NPDC058394]|uniref:FAD-dependent oxidoreductase n=1 Tax=Streptomyces sp. NPDC058394 TaxID=3346477 RepID=UPI0036682E91
MGYGKGGKTVAAKMGSLGKRVVLVERSDRMYGGTCPNVGCVPTKALVHHANKRRPEDPAQAWYERSVTKVQAVTKMVAISHTLFMTPPLATVGLTEKEARAAGHRVKIASQPVAEIIAMPRAYIVEDPRGVLKFVLDADTDDILGAALLSIDAQELINAVALAMRHGVKAAELRDAVYQHPTSTEAFNDVLATIVRAD